MQKATNQRSDDTMRLTFSPLPQGSTVASGKILSERHVLGVGDETGSRTVVETPLAQLTQRHMSGMSGTWVVRLILACSMRAI